MIMCEVCKGSSNTIDDRLGERVCDDCGYVMVSNLFEETQSNFYIENGEVIIRSGDRGILGSSIGQSRIDEKSMNRKLISRLRRNQTWLKDTSTKNMSKGLLECNMILSPWLPNDNLKERTNTYYKKFFSDRFSWRWRVSTRATAIVFLVLKENGMAVSLQELAYNNGENKQAVSKAARYFARKIRKPWLLHQTSTANLVDRTANKLVECNYTNKDQKRKRQFISDCRSITEYIEGIVSQHGIHFGKGHLACSFWITCLLRTRGGWPEYTQKEIGSSCGCAEITLRDNMRKLYKLLNTNKKELKRMRIEQFISGVRYG